MRFPPNRQLLLYHGCVEIGSAETPSHRRAIRPWQGGPSKQIKAFSRGRETENRLECARTAKIDFYFLCELTGFYLV